MHPLTLEPLDQINGFSVRPGLYEINGAMVVPGGVNFTIHSHGATSCELLLFHRKETVPYATIPFPSHYRIGHVYSMIIFGLDIEEFEYAYCLDGPYDEGKGLLFDKKKPLLDIYARAVTGQSVWGTKTQRAPSIKPVLSRTTLTGEKTVIHWCRWRIWSFTSFMSVDLPDMPLPVFPTPELFPALWKKSLI